MKFSLRDLEYKSDGKWTLTFKRVRVDAYSRFQTEFCNFPDDYYTEQGLDTNKMSNAEIQKLLDSSFEFMLANLIKAEHKEEGEASKDKFDVILSFVWEEPDFIEWSKGYRNGEKKT